MAMNFKSDDSFLRKLAVGAAGTNETIVAIKQFGFNPIELERGSTGFKIWKNIKIKRTRIPDILCLNTGQRFESRGKTKAEISMSHSLKDPKRVWDAGMRDDDFVSIVLFKQNEDDPLDVHRTSPVSFIRVSDLRSAFTSGRTALTSPKGVEEGSEIRVLWPCAVANEKSSVLVVDDKKICLSSISSNTTQTIRLQRGGKNNFINAADKRRRDSRKKSDSCFCCSGMHNISYPTTS